MAETQGKKQYCMKRRILCVSVLISIVVPFVLYQDQVMVIWTDVMTNKYAALDPIARVIHHESNLRTLPTHTLGITQDHKEIHYTEQQRRLAVIEKACQKLNKSKTSSDLSGKHLWHLIVDDEYKILFNLIPKVSSKAWQHVFHRMSVSYSRSSFRTLDKYTPEEIQFRLKHYRKAVFVREPFTRLLSSYLSKFCTYGKNQNVWEDEFGRYIVEHYREDKSQLERLTMNSTEPDNFLNITFSEFIQFVTDKSDTYKMDQLTDHFLPQNRVASPCAIHYDFIGHFENLTTEAPYMLDFLGAHNVTDFPEFHASKAANSLITEFQKVPLFLIKKLQQYYSEDYKIFGYSFNKTFKFITEGILKSDL